MKLDGADYLFTFSRFDVETIFTLRFDVNMRQGISNTWIKIYRGSTEGYVKFSTGADDGSFDAKIAFTTQKIKSYRVSLHDKFITVYINDVWVYTFSNGYSDYSSITGSEVPVYAKIESGYAAGTYIKQELYDWRGAIWVDLETVAMNAIQSIIQQRPVEIVGNYDGHVRFYYNRNVRDNVTFELVTRHEKERSIPQGLSSHAIVYFSDTDRVIHLPTLKKFGFITRIIRMPDLSTGAPRAASVMQQRAYESSEMHTIECRYNPEIDIDDLGHLSYNEIGTGAAINEYVIIENVSFALRNGEAHTLITGRHSE